MTESKQVGGLWCHEVMEVLAEVVDGTLEGAIATRVEAHVAECDQCSRFGAAYGEMVMTLRSRIAGADPLWERLDQALDESL